MPPRDEPVAGNIIPFPAAAIRRSPPTAFVTQPASPAPAPAPWRTVLAWLAIGSLVAAAIAGLLLLGAMWGGSRHAARHGGGSSPRSAVAAQPLATKGGMNVLIAGLDGEACAAAARGTCSDAIVLLHLDADRAAAWFVSIPRATRVSIPGYGVNRIDAAYALGGPQLFVDTMKQFTGLPIDHLAVLDRTGFRQLTDALGGVDLRLGPGRRARAASPTMALQMSGEMALDYVSPRANGADDDLDRIRREHVVLRGLLARLFDAHVFGDPQALRALAASLGDGVRLDGGLTPPALLALVGSAKSLGLENIKFLTAPVSPTAHEDDVVLAPDPPACAQLWDAVAHDELPAFVDAHPEWVTDSSAY